MSVTTTSGFILKWTIKFCGANSLARKYSGVSAEEVDCADCLKVWILRSVQ